MECLVIRRNPRPCHTIGIAYPLSGQEQPPSSSTSPLASVTEISLAIRSLAGAQRRIAGATPAEWLPFFGNAVARQ